MAAGEALGGLGARGRVLIRATVRAEPPLDVYLEKPEDAARLAGLSGVRVTLSFEPAEAGAGPARGPRRQALAEILRRVGAEPGRVFQGADFGDLLPLKSACSALSALHLRGLLDRAGRGRYRAAPGEPRESRPGYDVTRAARSLATRLCDAYHDKARPAGFLGVDFERALEAALLEARDHGAAAPERELEALKADVSCWALPGEGPLTTLHRLSRERREALDAQATLRAQLGTCRQKTQRLVDHIPRVVAAAKAWARGDMDDEQLERAVDAEACEPRCKRCGAAVAEAAELPQRWVCDHCETALGVDPEDVVTPPAATT